MNLHTYSFWRTIQHIQSALNLDDPSTAELLELTSEKFIELRDKRKSPAARGVNRFATQMGIGFDSLFTQQVNYKVLAQRFGGDSANAIPEKYLLNANSKRRTVSNILDFVEKSMGYGRRAQILRHFQLNESIFLKPNDPIHLNLTLDIAGYLHQINKNDFLLYKMGTYSVLQYRNTAVTSSLAESTGEVETYERMFCDIVPRFLEKNFRWEIFRVKDSRMILNGHPDEALLREIRAHPEKHRLACVIRSGFLGGMTAYTGAPVRRVMKSHCVSSGHAFCRYHVQL
ncbi:MAG: hypothetical protein H7333_10025 [Bdellovibrionales bacterium]|nr:hypothetical protein [Oligoflexia bacterium]